MDEEKGKKKHKRNFAAVFFANVVGQKQRGNHHQCRPNLTVPKQRNSGPTNQAYRTFIPGQKTQNSQSSWDIKLIL
jgi:hypothetical protein